MSIAVVFDSAGTLLHTYRVAKDVERQELLPGIETVTLTFSLSGTGPRGYPCPFARDHCDSPFHVAFIVPDLPSCRIWRQPAREK